MKKYYVGTAPGGKRHVFSSSNTPSQEKYGHLYSAVIGPFRTKRAAMFMAEQGGTNPHLRSVADAERIAKKYTKGRSR